MDDVQIAHVDRCVLHTHQYFPRSGERWLGKVSKNENLYGVTIAVDQDTKHDTLSSSCNENVETGDRAARLLETAADLILDVLSECNTTPHAALSPTPFFVRSTMRKRAFPAIIFA